MAEGSGQTARGQALAVLTAGAAALGWVLFQEGLSPLQGLGGVLALSGVVLAQRFAPAQSPAKP